MRRVAGYVLHYGAEYLPWSLRNILPVVDAAIIVYSAEPSFGFQRGVKCPDSRQKLYDAAYSTAFNSKIRWYDGVFHSEGAHRTAMHEHCRNTGAQTMIVLDADEVWSPESAEATMTFVENANQGGRWLARFQNFFRSWHYEVRDPFRPVRIVDFRHPLEGNLYLDELSQPEPVYHFGYAQSDAVLTYKWTCHGHQAELRQGWLEKYLAWTPDSTDLHPCINLCWDRAHLVDDAIYNRVCELMPDHPYRDAWRIA